MARKFILKWRDQYTHRVDTAVVLVDDEDAYRLRTCVWRVRREARTSRVLSGSSDRIRDLAHEIAGSAKGQKVWHLNGDNLDLRRSNLKLGAVPKNA